MSKIEEHDVLIGMLIIILLLVVYFWTGRWKDDNEP